MSTDPEETTNLATVQSDQSSVLKDQLQEWQSSLTPTTGLEKISMTTTTKEQLADLGYL